MGGFNDGFKKSFNAKAQSNVGGTGVSPVNFGVPPKFVV